MNRIIRILVTCTVLFSSDIQAGIPLVFGGIYSDNMNDGNIKVGVGYAYNFQEYDKEKEDKSESPSEFVEPFIYIDGELGQLGSKVTLGYGVVVCCAANIRGGLSYAEIEDTRYIGIEAIISPLFAAIKAGIYQDMDSGKYKYMIGVGFGW